MDKKELEKFLIKARLETYTSGGGKVEPALSGSTQLEFKEGDWIYRDVYYTGKNTFMGLETVCFKNKPSFGMSYYGNWGDMTEEEIDKILRGALVANPETRLYKKVSWSVGDFNYICSPDIIEGIDEIGGSEYITKNGEEICRFYYAGSVLS